LFRFSPRRWTGAAPIWLRACWGRRPPCHRSRPLRPASGLPTATTLTANVWTPRGSSSVVDAAWRYEEIGGVSHW